MFATVRWSLRLPRQHIRTLTTRSNTRGSRGTLRKPPSPSKPPRRHENTPAEPPRVPTKVEAVSNALSHASDADNNLVTPVHIPEDPNGVLKENHPAISLLDNSAIVVQRQLEMMNVLVGFEQANRYVIMDPHGNHIGYLAEQEHGIGNAIARQTFKTHRSFTTHVFDRHEKEVLRFHRPFSWISSRIKVYDAVGREGSYSASGALQGTSAGSIVNQTSSQTSSLPLSEMRIIGSAEQQWAPLRRKYNLFLSRDLSQTQPSPDTPQLTSGELPLSNSKALQVAEGDPREVGFVQFARVDEPFLSWDFSLLAEDGRLIGSVNRNFGGFAREIFTDTGVYALRMDAAGISAEPSHYVSQTGERAKHTLTESHPGMTLDQRAVMLATAVTIDFDYFSRHSGSGGFMPIWFPWWGGGAGEAGAAGAGAAGAAGAEAGAVGAAEAGAGAAVGNVARGGLGASEGAMAGAGTMAGYEAMQRGRQQGQQQDDASPQAVDPYEAQQGGQQQSGQPNQQEEVWGEDSWGNNRPEDQSPWGQGGQGGGEGGGGGGGEGGSFFDDWF